MTRRIGGLLALGVGAIGVLMAGLGGWATQVDIAGAVLAPGVVEVEAERQVIQHPDGGVVGAIFARDGDQVVAGDVLVRIDGTFLASERDLIDRQLFEIAARRARLEAIRDDLTAPDFSALAAMSTAGDAAWAKERVRDELRLFNVRAAALEQERRQTGEQIAQIGDEVDGLMVELAARQEEAEIVAGERANQEQLFENGLVPVARVLSLRREAARLAGDIGRLKAAAAGAEGRAAALELESLKRIEERRGDAIAEIASDRSREIALQERRLVLEERLARLELRAPVSGTVFGSRVSALKSVLRPAEAVMYLIPGEGRLNVSARVAPADADAVYAGQPVDLRFSAFDQRETAPIPGQVVRLSADVVVDDAGNAYFEAVIAPDTAALGEMRNLILPGMPVEAFIRTSDRTAMAYLTEPLMRYFARAFRGG